MLMTHSLEALDLVVYFCVSIYSCYFSLLIVIPHACPCMKSEMSISEEPAKSRLLGYGPEWSLSLAETEEAVLFSERH